MHPSPALDTVIQQGAPQDERPDVCKNASVALTLLSFVPIFIGFFFQCSGVVKSSKACREYYSYYNDDDEYCNDLYRYHWWVIVSQSALILIVAVALMTKTLNAVFMGVSVLMAVSISQMIRLANAYIDARGEDGHTDAAAGFIVATIGDIALVLAIGSAKMSSVQAVDDNKLREMMQTMEMWQRSYPQLLAAATSNLHAMGGNAQQMHPPAAQSEICDGLPVGCQYCNRLPASVDPQHSTAAAPSQIHRMTSQQGS